MSLLRRQIDITSIYIYLFYFYFTARWISNIHYEKKSNNVYRSVYDENDSHYNKKKKNTIVNIWICSRYLTNK